MLFLRASQASMGLLTPVAQNSCLSEGGRLNEKFSSHSSLPPRLVWCQRVIKGRLQQHRQHLAVGGVKAWLHLQLLPHLQRQQPVVVVCACRGA